MNEGSQSNANSEQHTCENTTEQYVRTCFGSSSENKLQLISEFLYAMYFALRLWVLVSPRSIHSFIVFIKTSDKTHMK